MLIPCAPIVNELVSSSLKHAFPDAHRGAAGNGEIRIELRHAAGNKFIMALSDNGVGLPEGFDAGERGPPRAPHACAGEVYHVAREGAFARDGPKEREGGERERYDDWGKREREGIRTV